MSDIVRLRRGVRAGLAGPEDGFGTKTTAQPRRQCRPDDLVHDVTHCRHEGHATDLLHEWSLFRPSTGPNGGALHWSIGQGSATGPIGRTVGPVP
jgi:hypothetical protein